MLHGIFITPANRRFKESSQWAQLRSVLLLVAVSAVVLALLHFTHPASAATSRTWTGGAGPGNTNWDEPTNWDTGVPGSGDIALFNVGSNPATINVSINIGGLQITSGYSGTITQATGASVTIGNSDFNQDGGAFTGSSNNDPISVSGNFILSGGTFTSTKGTLTLTGNQYTHNSGGAFLHNSGTVTFASVGTSPVVTLNGIETFNNLNLADSNADGRILFGTVIAQGALALIDGSFTSNGAVEAQAGVSIAPTFDGGNNTLLITAGDGSPRTITFAAGTNLQNVNLNAANVTINTSGSGTLTWKDVTIQAGVINQGNVDFVFAGTGGAGNVQSGGTFNASANAITFNNTFTLSGGALTGGAFNGGSGNITLNEGFTISGGIFTSTSGTFFLSKNFQHSTGTFNHNNGTVTFTGSTSGVQLSPPAGGETFNNLNFSKTNGANISVFGHVIAAGNLALNDGFVIGGPLNIVEARSGVTIASTFGGGSDTLSITNGSGSRTIDFPAGTNLLNISLDDSAVTINTPGSGTLNWQNVTLNAGTINQGGVDFVFGGNAFIQSGGTFNGSGNTITFNCAITQSGGVFTGGSGNITMNEPFILSAGTFTATSGTLLVVGGFAHGTGVGTFNHNHGTVTFASDLAHNSSSIQVADAASPSGGETFNNVNFNDLNGGNRFIFGTMIALGTLSFNDGFLTAGASGPLTRMEARGPVTVASTFDGSSMNMFFSGSADQTFTNNGAPNLAGTWTINKPAGIVTAASSVVLGTSQELDITSGSLFLSSGSNLTCGALTIGAAGKLINDSATTITLGGDPTNNGALDLQGSGASCPDSPDTILLRSSVSGTTRNWSGNGLFRVVDVDVQDQGGAAQNPPAISVFSGTDSGNNGANWTFLNSCPVVLSISPFTVNLPSGGTQTFTAGGGFGPRTFSLAVNNSGATINAASGQYTAGSTTGVTDTVRVTDSFGSTADATVDIFGVAVKMVFKVEPGNTTAGQSFTPALQVAIEDANNFTVTTATNLIMLEISNNPGGAFLSGNTSRNAVNGVVTFDNMSLNRSGSGYTLVASSASLANATSDPFDINPGSPFGLSFIVQPHDTEVHTVIAPPVQVAVTDSFGNIIPSAGNAITVGLFSSPAGTLSGTLTRNATNGVATFDDLSINDLPANGYKLQAASNGFLTTFSNAFNITRPTFFVTNTDDSGTGSLRQAIIDANNLIGSDYINFNIPGAPPFNIAPASQLPDITDAVIIDATSQPGFPGTPIIELSGNNNSTGSNTGLVLIGGNSTVKGLALNRFQLAIDIQSDGNTIQGNYIGTDVTGLTALPNFDGVSLSSSLPTLSGNLIGGTDATTRNVISGNTNSGLTINSSNNGNTVQGNFIGITASGNTALPNRNGFVCLSTNNLIGGTTAGAGNVIAGNLSDGLRIGDLANTVQGNKIGVGANGTSQFGNSTGVFVVSGGGGSIGGATGGAGNIIAFNLKSGVLVADGGHVSIRGNSIFGNGQLGIDLQPAAGQPDGPNNVTPNDTSNGAADSDTGGNNLQNFPTLASAISSGIAVTIQGSLNSATNGSFTIDFYSNQSCDPSGNGEGKTYLGSTSVTTDASGIVGFTANLPVAVPVGQFISATATDDAGNTSEFSQCTVASPTGLLISGTVKNSSFVPLNGVSVRLTGTPKLLTTVTDRFGNYKLKVPTGGNYTVTPVLSNFAFTPPNRTYTTPLTNQTNQDFVGTKTNFTINGSVKSGSQGTFPPLSGVTITLSGTSGGTTLTDNNGNYFFKNLVAGSYTVTAAKQGFTMTPPSTILTLTTADATANFIAQVPLLGRIAYMDDFQLKAMNADGSGLINLSSPGQFDPALSRDGKRIAFVENTNGQRLIIADYDGNNPVVLTNPTLPFQPAWSPDGARIAVASDKSLIVMDADGTSQKKVPFPGSGSQAVSYPTWAPDGTKIAFVLGNSAQIVVVDYPTGNNLTTLTTNADSPDWSPDGSKIIFRRSGSLFTMTAFGTDQQQVTFPPIVAGEPGWSPDSTKFVYARTNGGATTGEIAIANADGANTIVVGTTTGFLDKPSWSIDPTAPTSTGANVAVRLGGTSLSFSSVTASGSTTVTPIPPGSAGTLPGGFVLGNMAFEINTTAAVTPPINVCFTIPNSAAATPTALNALKLMHNEGGVLVDRTVSQTFGTPTSQLCGSVNSLSPFAQAQQVDGSLPSISGVILDSSDNPMSGVTVHLTGTEDRFTETDSDGLFDFANLTMNGSYNVEPKQAGFLFTNPNQDFTDLTDAQTVIFTGAQGTFSVDGHILDGNGNPVSGVEVTIEDLGVATTDASGYYSFPSLPAGATCLVTPAKAGLTFTLSQINLQNVSANQSNVDFIANAASAPTPTIAINHVIWVWFENKEATAINASSAPFFTSFAAAHANFANYFGVSHPSQPNYLDAFSGSNQGVTNDGHFSISAGTDNLGKQLSTAGKSWRIFAQNFPGLCFNSDSSSGGFDGPGTAGTYVRHHNPAMSLQNITGDSAECANVQPLANFDPTVNFAMVVPNLTNDMHDGTIAQGDAFLQAFVPLVTSSPDWAHTLLIVTFDEGTTNANGGGHVYTAAAAPWLNHTSITTTYNHFSLLRTTEDIFGLPHLGNAASATTITELLPLLSVPDAPTVSPATTNEDTQTTSGLVITKNTLDENAVAFFVISNIRNGTLFKNDGTTQINNGNVITAAEGNVGLKFTPAANIFGSGHFDVQASTANDGSNAGPAATATITVNAVADTPSITSTSTNEDTQSTTGLVISRNAADGAEVTHFKITAITGGTLFQNNGTTQINNGDFITFAQANVGLKFTPAANLNNPGSTFSFDVQASMSNSNAGLGGGVVTATVSVTAVNDAPSFTKGANQSVNENAGAQTVSNWATNISAGPADESGQTLNFIVTNNNNALFSAQPGVSAAGVLTYTPAANVNGSATVSVSLHDNGGTANGGVDTSAVQTQTISVNSGGTLQLSASTYAVAENTGPAVITITRTGGSAGTATAKIDTSNGTATAGSDYTAISQTVTFNDGETSKTVNVPITDDLLNEPDETVNLTLSNAGGTATLSSPATAVLTITNDDPVGGYIKFSAPNYNVNEGDVATITVQRVGTLTQAATVDYATTDSGDPAAQQPCAPTPGNTLASSRCDFTSSFGRLTWAAGDGTDKTFKVMTTQDYYVEGPETLTLTLSNLTGGAGFSGASTELLTINDDAVEPPGNPVDDSNAFVEQLYRDFLNRPSDASGKAFWVNNIDHCIDPAQRPPGLTAAQCIETSRIVTAGAFFLSIEFQTTGGAAYLTNKVSSGITPNFVRFERDAQQIGQGYAFGAPGAETLLEANKVAYFNDYVTRPEFAATYGGVSNQEYVNTLISNTGVPFTQHEKDALINGLANQTETRATVLRKISEKPEFRATEFNSMFVLMEYYGFLRRNPDQAGFNFWLNKLNNFNGDYFAAEMVKAFIESMEYRQRFGTP
jgi:protocatechuate 3,4-dioxygenase beta subunit